MMISKIFVPTFTILKRYHEEQPFHDFVVEEYPGCIKYHLPKSIKSKSIEYRKDGVIDSFLEMLVRENSSDIREMIDRGLEVETGVYILQLEAEESLTHLELPEMEFVFQKLHESYSFISSYMYYLDKFGLNRFAKLHTFESDVEFDEDGVENFQDFADLLDSYFYKGEIPDYYADEVAKMMLLQGRI